MGWVFSDGFNFIFHPFFMQLIYGREIAADYFACGLPNPFQTVFVMLCGTAVPSCDRKCENTLDHSSIELYHDQRAKAK